MSEHTKEPWIVTGSERIKYVESRVGGGILQEIASCMAVEYGDHEANARRIVACVNACRGLDTAELEKNGLVSAVGSELLQLDRQRDEALAELKKLNDLLNSGDWSVLRADGRMTLPYTEAEKAAEDLQAFIKYIEENKA